MEKTPKAVALKYDQEKSNAPKVIAKGRGEMAEKMISWDSIEQITEREVNEIADALLELENELEFASIDDGEASGIVEENTIHKGSK